MKGLKHFSASAKIANIELNDLYGGGRDTLDTQSDNYQNGVHTTAYDKVTYIVKSDGTVITKVHLVEK
jgi:hypothetical protein